MRLSHTRAAVTGSFDDPNLVSAGGLVPVMRLAAAAGLDVLADRLLSVPTDKGAAALGINAGAITSHATPIDVSSRNRPNPVGPAS